MCRFLPTTIFRHRKENLKKCSLNGLEGRSDLEFLTYPIDPLPPLEGQVVLSMEGPLLSEEDKGKGLLLIDGTWKYAALMERQVKGEYERRSLPKGFRTSYPRKQTECKDPERGLASVEALYIAYHILGYETVGLLDHYYWREAFLELNSLLLGCTSTSP